MIDKLLANKTWSESDVTPAIRAMLETQQMSVQMDQYACSDCHYSENYLSDEAFPKALDSYEGWEQVKVS
jgi:hypothetical protein